MVRSLISLSPSHATRRSGSLRTSSSGTTIVPPPIVAMRISMAETSKLMAEYWAMRRGGSMPVHQTTRLTSAPPGMTTALGTPVEPEV